jgi:hypothetical protein
VSPAGGFVVLGASRGPRVVVLGLVALAATVFAAAATRGWAQTGGRLSEEQYLAWRAEHAAALDAAAAAVAEASLEERAPRLASVMALADAAARVRPPETLLGAHAQYLIAVERLRLAAQAATGADATPEAATALAAARAGLQALLATGTLPPSEPGPPPVLSPLPPAEGLAQARNDHVALWLLALQQPAAPAEGEPPAHGEYLALRVRLQNVGTDVLAYYPLADFTLLTADGVVLRPVGLGIAERLEAGELRPGDSLITTVTFLLVPGAQPAVLRFAPAAGPALELPLSAPDGASQSHHDRPRTRTVS